MVYLSRSRCFNRPPESLADLGFTTILSIFDLQSSSSSSLFRQLPSELAEQNSNKTGHMLGTECDLKIYVRNLGYALPQTSLAPKAHFSKTSQLNGNFDSLYLLFIAYKSILNHSIRNRTSALETALWVKKHAALHTFIALANVGRFQNFFTAELSKKFATLLV